jgi:hypothetical protein
MAKRIGFIVLAITVITLVAILADVVDYYLGNRCWVFEACRR